MADNIIKRIIQMVLDKDSAKKTQADANQLAAGIDSTWKNLASKVAGYLAAGFLISKIVGVGKAAVEEAMSAEKAWKMLKGTIDSTGESFDDMEVKIRAQAAAFQDATIHDDDAYAESLNRLIALTGDVSASINNMALVANVAAQYFDGDLQAATNAVGRAMNGNMRALKKMGIEANSAQEALEILAERSMGAAEREAGTFSGQLKQMDVIWKNVLEDIGKAIIASDGSTTAFTFLRAALETLAQWVANNSDAIQLWVTNGIKFAIDATDVLIRAIGGMAQILAGGFMTSIGGATWALSKFGLALLKLQEWNLELGEMTGHDVSKDLAKTRALIEQGKAYEEWGKKVFEAGQARTKSGVDFLSTPLFTSDQFANAPKGPRKKLPGEDVRPVIGKNASTDETKAITKAIQEYEKAAKSAAAMEEILGDKFDKNGAELDRNTKLFQALVENGVNPAETKFAFLGDRIFDLTNKIIPLDKASTTLGDALENDLSEGALTAANSVDTLKRQQSDTLNVIKELRKTLDDTDPSLQIFIDKYNELTNAVKEAEDIQKTAEIFHNLSEEMRSGLFQASLDSATALDKLTMRKQALAKAMMDLHRLGKAESKDMQELQRQYKDTTKAIEQQTRVMQYQAAAADFLAEALGVALAGGIHEAAAAKAKQNAIEAGEMLVRAGAFALFGNFPKAGAALALAAQFGGIAAAWGALALATKGSGGSGGSSVPSISTSGAGGAAGAGEDLTSSRDTSRDATSRAQQPSAEVSIYLVGPGFNALNPEVQRVVYGAQQQAEERYGPNARITVRR